MELIREIWLQSFELLILIAGILGLAFSLLLLFFPNGAKALSNLFDYNVHLDKTITGLNRGIQIDGFVYRHNILFGACLVTCSIVALILLFFNLDTERFADIFTTSRFLLLSEVVFPSLIIASKICGFAGIALGFFLLFSPDKIKSIQNIANRWFATQPIVDKLDEFHNDIDPFFYRHQKLFGVLGLIFSIILIILSIMNLPG